MRISVVRLLICIAVGLPFARTSMAQEGMRDRGRNLGASQQIVSDLQKARFHYGSIYLLSRFELMDLGYDQSFYVPTQDQGNGVSLGLSAPHRLYFVPSKKVVLSGDFVPQYTIQTGKNHRSQFGYSSRADVQFLLNHLYLDAYGTHADSLKADTGEIDRLTTIRSTDVGVNGEIKYSSRTSATFSAAGRNLSHPASRIQPTDVAVELLDRKERNYRASIVHKTFPLTSLLVAGEWSDYTFTHATYKDATRRVASAGAIFDNGVTSGRLEVGEARLLFNDPTQHDFRGAVGSFEIARHPASRWSYGASATRDLEFSILAFNNYYIEDRVQASINHNATRSLSLRLSTQIGRDLYDVPAPDQNFIFRKRRDDISFTSVGWVYTFANRLRGGFDIGYYQRKSNFDVTSQNGIRGILHLSFTP
ncbi:MAG TPA: outer membrane beta-barrel protein [Thermoanaerobaculia bacterium]|nr:outer membrane beta-barrel protein [Thermoanaerobaculia bacterium]